MQWQRVLHGFGNAIEHAGRIHSVYEFSLKEIPGQLIRVRVVETPEGRFFALPDHFIQSGGQPPQVPPRPEEPACNAEKALQDAIRALIDQVRPPYDQLRLVRRQNW